MCVIKFNGTHTLQGFHEDDHRIVRRTCEFFCGYIVLAGQCQAPAAAIKSLFLMSPQPKVKDTFLEWEPVYYGQNFYFRIKLKNIFLVHVMIKLIKWDGTLSDEANFLLLYILKYYMKLIIFQLQLSNPIRVQYVHWIVHWTIRCQYPTMSSNVRLLIEKGVSNNFIGSKLLNLSKDVLDYMSFVVYTLMYMYMIYALNKTCKQIELFENNEIKYEIFYILQPTRLLNNGTEKWNNTEWNQLLVSRHDKT